MMAPCGRWRGNSSRHIRPCGGNPGAETVSAGNFLRPASQGLQIVDAFGFDQFTNVFTAKYRLPNGATNVAVLAFLELAKTSAAAAALRDCLSFPSCW